MSQEDLEVVRRIYETLAVCGPEAADEYLGPNIERLPPKGSNRWELSGG
jgi:hypothetical protein